MDTPAVRDPVDENQTPAARIRVEDHSILIQTWSAVDHRDANGLGLDVDTEVDQVPLEESGVLGRIGHQLGVISSAATTFVGGSTVARSSRTCQRARAGASSPDGTERWVTRAGPPLFGSIRPTAYHRNRPRVDVDSAAERVLVSTARSRTRRCGDGRCGLPSDRIDARSARAPSLRCLPQLPAGPRRTRSRHPPRPHVRSRAPR